MATKRTGHTLIHVPETENKRQDVLMQLEQVWSSLKLRTVYFPFSHKCWGISDKTLLPSALKRQTCLRYLFFVLFLGRWVMQSGLERIWHWIPELNWVYSTAESLIESCTVFKSLMKVNKSTETSWCNNSVAPKSWHHVGLVSLTLASVTHCKLSFLLSAFLKKMKHVPGVYFPNSKTIEIHYSSCYQRDVTTKKLQPQLK